jgi:hypothetical protein
MSLLDQTFSGASADPCFGNCHADTEVHRAMNVAFEGKGLRMIGKTQHGQFGQEKYRERYGKLNFKEKVQAPSTVLWK